MWRVAASVCDTCMMCKHLYVQAVSRVTRAAVPRHAAPRAARPIPIGQAPHPLQPVGARLSLAADARPPRVRSECSASKLCCSGSAWWILEGWCGALRWVNSTRSSVGELNPIADRRRHRPAIQTLKDKPGCRGVQTSHGRGRQCSLVR